MNLAKLLAVLGVLFTLGACANTPDPAPEAAPPPASDKSDEVPPENNPL